MYIKITLLLILILLVSCADESGDILSVSPGPSVEPDTATVPEDSTTPPDTITEPEDTTATPDTSFYVRIRNSTSQHFDSILVYEDYMYRDIAPGDLTDYQEHETMENFVFMEFYIGPDILSLYESGAWCDGFGKNTFELYEDSGIAFRCITEQ